MRAQHIPEMFNFARQIHGRVESIAKLPGKKWKKGCLEKKDTTNLTKRGGVGEYCNNSQPAWETQGMQWYHMEREEPHCEEGEQARTCTEFPDRD